MAEYENIEAERLRIKLLETNQNISIEDYFKGEEFVTETGSCYKISEKRKLKFHTPTKLQAKNNLLNDLKLIKGIGDSKAKILKSKGFESIEDLREHPTYSADACQLYDIVDEGDFSKITDYISTRYPKSHPTALFSSCFSPDENFLFLDIETMGLKGVPIILIGVARVKSGNITVIIPS